MEMDILDRFHEDLELRALSTGTVKSYTDEIRNFAKYLNGKDLSQADKEDMKRFLNYLRREKKLKNKSIEWKFSALATFYDFLEEEELVSKNPVISVRKRYLHSYKNQDEQNERRCISIEEASQLVNSIIDTRDRAIVLLLLKTGMRRHELVDLDVADVDLKNKTILLKPAPKRSNRMLFFDEETAATLQRWMLVLRNRARNSDALFIGPSGDRLASQTIKNVVIRHSARVGLHNPKSKRFDERFTPHFCRHWFTTHLIRAGMPRDFVKELRGDVRHEAIDIYNHIDKKELRESYLAHIPQLGI
jgi:integrase/recombinase XerD